MQQSLSQGNKIKAFKVKGKKIVFQLDKVKIIFMDGGNET